MCAISIDGRLAPTKEGSSRVFGKYIPQYFTDKLMRLRETADGIMVGSNTVLRDDPQLSPPSRQTKLRITIDRKGKLTSYPHLKLLSDTNPTLIITTKEGYERYRGLSLNSFKYFLVAENVEADLLKIFSELRQKCCIKTLLVEGGGGLFFLLLKKLLIQEMNILILPYVVGEEGAPSIVSGTESFFSIFKFTNFSFRSI